MKKLIWIIVPTLLLAGFIILFLTGGSPGISRRNLPPVERIAVERIEMRQDKIILHIINDGPDVVTVQQVIVNDAYRQFSINPGSRLERLARAVVTIPYPWDQGEAQHITLLSATGVTFPVEIEAAALSPPLNLEFMGSLGLLGVYIGIIPVFLGILWLPFLKRVNETWYRFFLALTLGLLLFLGIDSLAEAVSASGMVPESLHATGLVVIGFSLAFLLIYVVSIRSRKRAPGQQQEASHKSGIALSIAIGIGIHNLGEGLAAGGAYALGEASLGAALAVGFMIHNLTEGIAIVAPVSRVKSGIKFLVLLGIVAGAPAVAGAWIGGFAYSPFWAVLFLSIGAGAIFQVFIDILLHISGGNLQTLLTFRNVTGFLAGLGTMYLTSLLVAL